MTGGVTNTIGLISGFFMSSERVICFFWDTGELDSFAFFYGEGFCFG
jgi:hypothetical protein